MYISSSPLLCCFTSSSNFSFNSFNSSLSLCIFSTTSSSFRLFSSFKCSTVTFSEADVSFFRFAVRVLNFSTRLMILFSAIPLLILSNSFKRNSFLLSTLAAILRELSFSPWPTGSRLEFDGCFPGLRSASLSSCSFLFRKNLELVFSTSSSNNPTFSSNSSSRLVSKSKESRERNASSEHENPSK